MIVLLAVLCRLLLLLREAREHVGGSPGLSRRCPGNRPRSPAASVMGSG